MFLQIEEVSSSNMVMLVRLNTLPGVVKVNVMFLKSLQDVNVNRRWIKPD